MSPKRNIDRIVAVQCQQCWKWQDSGQRDPRSLIKQFSVFLTFFFFCFLKMFAPRRDACNHQHPRALP